MCTHTALKLVAGSLEEEGIGTEIFFPGPSVLNGSIDTAVSAAAEKMKTCDGLIVGAPVYYASPSGEIVAFLDRLFMTASPFLRCKPAAAVCSARRAGTTASIDVLNKYFTIAEMPVVSSTYWNMVHGNTPEEVLRDEEGVQVMRRLGKNMSWLLKCVAAGEKAGVERPLPEAKIKTNFIR